MAYFKQYHANGTTEIDSDNPLDFGTLNKDDEEVSDFIKVVIKTVQDGAPDPLVSTGDTTVTITDGASTDYFQLAPDNEGVAGTPEAYGAALTITSAIDATTGVPYWVRRAAQTGESPAVLTDVTLDASGVVVPA